ncbi:hypothetical protein ANCDUO_15533 [Ancylostoma duodenale]|uniref:Uncharacterized protein n=1 Tax=Ancylostoma duodenale TaxID=51022 RepID=A0A0C2CWR7_9BILA|nr:hypothetical protein ANCDUO_15533 [Ancylostoma duodenale]
MDIYRNLSANSTASAVVDTVYGRTPVDCDNRDDASRFTPWTGEHACSISGRVVNLTNDQCDAVALDVSELPVKSIQVAQFTETILSLDAYRNLAIVRYVSAAPTENLTPTPVDLNEILKNLGDE